MMKIKGSASESGSGSISQWIRGSGSTQKMSWIRNTAFNFSPVCSPVEPIKKLSPVRGGMYPPGTPTITPGTQIILAEGVAGPPTLPQHPLPLDTVNNSSASSSSSPVTISISRCLLS